MLEFIRHLNLMGARSMVIGGYALAFLGVPRYTKYLRVLPHSSTPAIFKRTRLRMKL